MGILGKIDSEVDKAKARNLNRYEKTKAEFESDGVTKKLKQTGSDIKKNIKVAKADLKEKIS